MKNYATQINQFKYTMQMRKFLNTIEKDTMQMENHIIQMKIIQCK